MKRLLFVLCVALAVSCLAFGQATPQKAPATQAQSVEQELIALERAWLEADRTQDVAWFERHLAPNVVLTNYAGVVSNKAEVVARTKSGARKIESARYEDLKVQVYADAAIVTGLTVQKATLQGKDLPAKVRWTDTWVRLGGQWQCVAAQATGIAPQ